MQAYPTETSVDLKVQANDISVQSPPIIQVIAWLSSTLYLSTFFHFLSLSFASRCIVCSSKIGVSSPCVQTNGVRCLSADPRRYSQLPLASALAAVAPTHTTCGSGGLRQKYSVELLLSTNERVEIGHCVRPQLQCYDYCSSCFAGTVCVRANVHSYMPTYIQDRRTMLHTHMCIHTYCIFPYVGHIYLHACTLYLSVLGLTCGCGQKLRDACGVFSTNKGRVLRPKEGDRVILLLKDINLPKPDKYAVSPTYVPQLFFCRQLLPFFFFLFLAFFFSFFSASSFNVFNCCCRFLLRVG